DMRNLEVTSFQISPDVSAEEKHRPGSYKPDSRCHRYSPPTYISRSCSDQLLNIAGFSLGYSSGMTQDRYISKPVNSPSKMLFILCLSQPHIVESPPESMPVLPD